MYPDCWLINKKKGWTVAYRPMTPSDMQYSLHPWKELSVWKSGSRLEILAEVSAGIWNKKIGKFHSWCAVRVVCFVMHDVSAVWEYAVRCKWNRYGQEASAFWGAEKKWCPLIIIIIIIIIIITTTTTTIRYGWLLSQAFSSWYFSWTRGDPHCSGFKLHTAVLSILCVMFQV